MKRLLFYLLVGWTIAAALASCRTTQPTPGRDLSRAEGTPYVAQPDSGKGNPEITPPGPPLEQKTGFLGLFGKKNTPSKPETKIIAGAQPGPRKCKGCNIYYAPATVTTNTAAKNATAGTGATGGGKADGPVAGMGATATDNTKAGQRGGAAATAPNATATATTIKPPAPWLKYGLWAAGALGLYWVLFGGGGALLLALFRRNKPTDTTA